MCGIVGYIGLQDAVPVIMQGLSRLAYRGYDSAGLASIVKGAIALRREHGKLENLAELLVSEPISGSIGIGHTRWATHGKPNKLNAHPQVYGKVAVVHNGIIENYAALRNTLEAKGEIFSSETDTEVIAHLINDALQDGKKLLDAVRDTCAKLEGSYALAIIAADNPDEIIVVRHQSPLVIAIGKNECYIASDVTAILEYCRNIIFLEDGDYASVKTTGCEIYNKKNILVTRPVQRITWDLKSAEKHGYKHYMLKEIFEQPEKLIDTFRARFLMSEGQVKLEPSIVELKPELSRKIHFIGCGTSYHAGLLGKYLIESCARLPVDVDVASEFRYRDPIIGEGDLIIAVSQSGETADTLACVQLAKERGAKILAICNVIDSSIPRLSHATLYTRADAEIGVCSTKAFTTQLASIMLLAIYLGRESDKMSAERARELMQTLRDIPAQIEEMLKEVDNIREVAKSLLRCNSFLFLGRGVHYPIAKEGALKLKEITYIHAEAYPSGEMKHGPIALIDEKLPVIVISPKNSVYSKTLSNLQEVKARGGRIISVVTQGDEDLKEISDFSFTMPNTDEFAQPLLSIIPLQLLAYHLSDLLGNDVDQPRNLAKSVTVE
ncbi:MAG: glutamine--fructose-6-phosphate transaminase (isomerizing) [Bradymonadales bacterium]|jgi:glucosamine--fructose-6-phosphate aminotransferase (isomerizing)